MIKVRKGIPRQGTTSAPLDVGPLQTGLAMKSTLLVMRQFTGDGKMERTYGLGSVVRRTMMIRRSYGQDKIPTQSSTKFY